MEYLMEPVGPTSMSKKEYTFSWTLENVSYEEVKSGLKESPIFTGEGDEKFQFRLIYHRCLEERPSSSLRSESVRKLILCCSNIESEVTCTFDVTIHLDGRKIVSKSCGGFQGNNNLVVHKVYAHSRKDFVWPKKTTAIQCKITLSRSTPTSSEDSSSEDMAVEKPPAPGLKFDSLFLEETLSDVKLLTKSGREIPAHKILLAVASPVFMATFSRESSMPESSQVIDLSDVGEEIAVEMLRFVYTGEVDDSVARDISKTAELFEAGHRYAIEGLKNKCERMLSSNLSSDNVLETLRLADAYKANDLKMRAIDFVKHSINNSEDFDEITNMLLSKTRLVDN